MPPLQEETEGYSKLIAELSELPSAGGADNTSTRGCKSANEVVMNIQSLIGYFDLDPNRVLDLVLEALEAVPSRVANKQLVSLFNPEFIPHMIGFKFSLYSGRGASAPPESLYNMCGLLLAQGSVSLEAILPHLTPDIKTMADLDEKRASEKRTEARKKGQVSLGGGGDASGGGGFAGLSAKNAMGSQVGSRKSLADFGSLDGGDDKGGGSSSQPTAGAAEAKAAAEKSAEAEEEELSTSTEFEKLQPLGLLRALLKARDWKAARQLIIELDGVDVAAYPPVAEALCELLDWLTEPAYRPIAPSTTLFSSSSAPAPAVAATESTEAAAGASSGPVAEEAEDSMDVDGDGALAASAQPSVTGLTPATTPTGAVFAAVPLLRMLGPYLHTEPLLIARMCRLCVAAMAEKGTEQKVVDAIDACIDLSILPALTVSSANPGLVHELWRLLEKRPYTARSRSYGVLHNKLKELEAHPELAMARAKTADDTKKMMRRLSKRIPNNTDAIWADHALRSSVVFDTILEQIQAYDNLIVPVVEMMKYLPHVIRRRPSPSCRI